MELNHFQRLQASEWCGEIGDIVQEGVKNISETLQDLCRTSPKTVLAAISGKILFELDHAKIVSQRGYEFLGEEGIGRLHFR
jgi:hypothetical protein